MFEIASRPAPFPTYVLRDTEADSAAEIVPARGGFLSRFDVGGVPVVAFDAAGTYDAARSVRGGMPLLFPLAGKLEGDQYMLLGRPYSMRQHGLARQMNWKVAGRATDGAARFSLELSSDETTRSSYPFDWKLASTYELCGGALNLRLEVRNLSTSPMPFQVGFHPYIFVPEEEKDGTEVTTNATLAFDNLTGQDVPFTGFDFTAAEVDLHLHDHGRADCTLTRLGLNGEIRVSASPELSRWVFWTKKGGDYVCVEPWTAPARAWRDAPGASGLRWLGPAASEAFTVSIELLPAPGV